MTTWAGDKPASPPGGGGALREALLRDDPGRTPSRPARVAEAVLAEVLTEQVDPGILALADDAKALAEGLRSSAPASDRLVARLAELDTRSLAQLARIATLRLALANLAEDVTRTRAERADLAVGELPAPESLEEAALRVRRAGARPDLAIALVLTAHPTAIARRSVLSKQRTVVGALDRLSDEDVGPRERGALLDELREAVAIWWATNEVRSMRPRVQDEVRRGLHFFETALVDATVDLCVDYVRLIEPEDRQRPPLRFGSWAGADMDGNPNVGAHTVLDTVRAHRIAALEMLIGRISPLREQLSQSKASSPDVGPLRRSLTLDAAELPRTDLHQNDRHPFEREEPIRRKLAFILARLQNTLAETRNERVDEPGYATPDQLVTDLELIVDSLGSRFVSSGRIDRVLWQVRVFGFHLATLELREDAGQLQDACGALLPGYARLETEEERAAMLTRACLREYEHVDIPAPRAAAALDAVATAQRAYGTASVDTLVISNAEAPSDVLCALWLARRSGLYVPRSNAPALSRIDIVPLFERRVAIEGAQRIMAVLYGNPAYAGQLDARGERQQIMLGYSDSSKEGGVAASQWTLYAAQERLAEQARARGVHLRLFHGRGGAPSRGGGPVYRTVLAQPPGTVGGHIKLTEQGEVVSRKFARRESATRSLERTVAAVIHATVEPDAEPRESWRAEMERIAIASRSAYQRFVVHSPEFQDLFAECTPLEALDRLNLASRPSRRGSDRGFSSLRAIPWVFAWTQARMWLPSWLGAGTALTRGDLELQREMWTEWPFFHHLITTVEVALAASDPLISEHYLSLSNDREAVGEVWSRISAERDICEARVRAITRRDRLLDPGDEALRNYERRLPWLDLASLVQVEALRRLRDGDESAHDPLVQSVTGIAAGMRRTG